MSWIDHCPRCQKNFTREMGDPRECRACITKQAEFLAAMADAKEDSQEDDLIDAEADAQEDHTSMVESRTDRVIREEEINARDTN